MIRNYSFLEFDSESENSSIITSLFAPLFWSWLMQIESSSQCLDSLQNQHLLCLIICSLFFDCNLERCLSSSNHSLIQLSDFLLTDSNLSLRRSSIYRVVTITLFFRFTFENDDNVDLELILFWFLLVLLLIFSNLSSSSWENEWATFFHLISILLVVFKIFLRFVYFLSINEIEISDFMMIKNVSIRFSTEVLTFCHNLKIRW